MKQNDRSARAGGHSRHLQGPEAVNEDDVIPSVVVVLPSLASLLEERLGPLTDGGLFVHDERRLGVGRAICLDLAIVKEHLSMQSPGIVRWRRHRGARGLPKGIGVQLLMDPTGMRLRELALAASVEQRSRRYHVHLAGRCRYMFCEIDGVIRDISRTGAFLESADLLAVGCETKLTVALTGNEPLDLLARVERVEVRGRTGLGLKFIEVGPGSRRRLATVLDRIAQQAIFARGSEKKK